MTSAWVNFHLKDASGTVIREWESTAEPHVIFGLAKGASYTLHEVKSPPGYLKAADIAFTVGADGRPVVGGVASDAVDMADMESIVDISLSASKLLFGRGLQDEQFSFMLVGANNAPMPATPISRNDAAGKVSFSGIRFRAADVGKVCVYTIREVDDGKPGYSYDGFRFLKVEVGSDPDGNLTFNGGRAASFDLGTFSNSYAAKGTFRIQVPKELSGRALRDGEFSFRISAPAGTPMPDLLTASATASGIADFGTVTYTQADAGKTYTYTVTEENTGIAGVAYDPETSKVLSVSVSDNGDGTMSANGMRSGTLLVTAFENAYTAKGSLILTAFKRIDGAFLKPGQFEFELRDSSGAVVSTAENATDGSVQFSPLEYDQDDAGKRFTYTVSEKDGGLPGVSYDAEPLKVNVMVMDTGSGSLSVNGMTCPPGGSVEMFTKAFDNSYRASAVVEIAAEKMLSGRNLAAGEFEFALSGSAGAPMPSQRVASNAADGKVSFGTVRFTQADAGKTYTYVIEEVKGDVPGVAYDATSTRRVSVRISDNGDGTLSVSGADGGIVKPVESFRNSYGASASLALNASKVLDGRDIEAGQFEFELRDENGSILDSAVNDADGKVVFKAIDYTEQDAGRTFSYTVSEKTGNSLGYSYDRSEHEIRIMVSDNGDGSLNIASDGFDVAGSKGSFSLDVGTFENSYSATGQLSVSGEKSAEGFDLEGGQFEFELTDGDGDIIEVVGNDGNGHFEFAPISYSQDDVGKTFTYSVRESLGLDQDPSVSYDPSVFAVTAKV